MAAGSRAQLGLQYGFSQREEFDVFWPQGSPEGLMFFVHGGSWRSLDRSFWSHFARGALDQGWVVAMPSYTLAPQASISGITLQIVSALRSAAALVQGSIKLVGHSAGGHLVMRMMCRDVTLPTDISSRIERAVSISGFHDLRPLLQTALNEQSLRLDEAEAIAESHALQLPRENSRLICCVGADEPIETLLQSKLLTRVWQVIGAHTAYLEFAGCDHYSVLDGLQDANSDMCVAIFGP